MRLLGHDDLQGRSAYQPVIHRQGNRFIAYVGHHGGLKSNPLTGQMERNGTSIVDVTDPRRPRYLVTSRAPREAEAGGAQMVRVCDGASLPRGTRGRPICFARSAISPTSVGFSDSAKPALLTTVVAGLNMTHKNWWECDSGIAYLVSDGHPRGWRTHRMTKIYDLSDPAQPRFIRDFGLVGQEPGSTGPAPEGVHGPSCTRTASTSRTARLRGRAAGFVDRDKLLAGDPAVADRFRSHARQLLLSASAGST